MRKMKVQGVLPGLVDPVEIIREYMRENARKGGSRITPEKRAAAQVNVRKAIAARVAYQQERKARAML